MRALAISRSSTTFGRSLDGGPVCCDLDNGYSRFDTLQMQFLPSTNLTRDRKLMPHTLFFRNDKYGQHSSLVFPRGIAFLAQGHVWYSGVNFGGSIQSQAFSGDWSSLKQWIADTFGDTSPIESEYQPGTAYKRICWPLASSGTLSRAIDTVARTQSFVALRLLLSKMTTIFDNIEPNPRNLDTFGHNVRELLLLAAMEVEASWAAVLKANGYSARRRLSTNDYVKLLDPMLLDSYSLKLTSYPSFPAIIPFEGWSASAPTQSLDWYDAYNATKHNREEHLDQATLVRAVKAVGAAVVMFYAQFGYTRTIGDELLPFIGNIFKMNFDGNKHPYSYYFPNVNTAAGTVGPAGWEWMMLEYPFVP